MFGIIIVGGIGLVTLGGFSYYKLNEELFPLKVGDFDYNLKHCLQEIGWLKRDIEYIKASIKANKSLKLRKERKRMEGKINYVVDILSTDEKTKILVYKNHTNRDFKEQDVEKFLEGIRDIGLSAEYSADGHPFSDDIAGTIFIKVDID